MDAYIIKRYTNRERERERVRERERERDFKQLLKCSLYPLVLGNS